MDKMIVDVVNFLNETLSAYIATALWSETLCGCGEHPCGNAEFFRDINGGNEPCDRSLSSFGFRRDDIDGGAVAQMEADIVDFVMGNWADVSTLDAERVGHDFWLTRNRHGAGFWDRGLGEIGDRLTIASKPYGEYTLYVGDDGKVYGS